MAGGQASGPLDILADLTPRNGNRLSCAISQLRQERSWFGSADLSALEMRAMDGDR